MKKISDPILNSLHTNYQTLKSYLHPYEIGLSILAFHLSVYHFSIFIGLPPLLASPLFNQLIEWVLWDPKIIVFRLQDMGLSVASACYAVWQKDWQGLKELFTTQVSVALITVFLKNMVGRLRPNGADNHSFPSGHSSAAFTAASYVHQRYGLDKALIPYMCASVIGCVRVYKQAHFPSDVFVGAGIGILTAYNMVTQKSNAPVSDDTEALVQPSVEAKNRDLLRRK